jgi:hypothetical protein
LYFGKGSFGGKKNIWKKSDFTLQRRLFGDNTSAANKMQNTLIRKSGKNLSS